MTTDPIQALATAYRERVAIDQRIARLESEVALRRDTARAEGRSGRVRNAPCGTPSAYYKHIRKGMPFPEDYGQPACGCRLAHAREESKRAAARRAANQVTGAA